MNDSPKKLPPLEDGILRALMAIDRQVAREMQRSPEERETHGVQKWEPYEKRVELLTAFILDRMGEGTIDLDGLLVLAQVMSKALLLIAEDLGADGLGKVRTGYCLHAFEALQNDGFRGVQLIGGTRDVT